jgi:hypothetical protein
LKAWLARAADAALSWESADDVEEDDPPSSEFAKMGEGGGRRPGTKPGNMESVAGTSELVRGVRSKADESRWSPEDDDEGVWGLRWRRRSSLGGGVTASSSSSCLLWRWW